jgi:magnesium-transporting ATPase (P-type)
MKSLVDKKMATLIVLITLASALTAFGAFWYFWHHGDYGLAHARTVAFAVLGLNSLFYVWSVRSLSKPIWRSGILQNSWLIGAVLMGLGLQLFGMYSSLGQRLLGTVSLDVSEWTVVLTGSFLMIAIVEGVKWSYNRKT